MVMKAHEIERIEVDLLLEAVFRRYGYDFRSYARASIDRRVSQFIMDHDITTLSELIPKVLHDPHFFSKLASAFSVSVTEMFRDPFVYRAVRNQVIPMLKTWPHIKIWHAGCATGEEVYSLAILLKEEGLYDRATIYATDFNDESLEKARSGIYDIEKIKGATRNYHEAGGQASFSEYYHARYDAAILDASLRKRMTFANHNLVSDAVFGEMHLIFCRNVLIYFNRDLQNHVLELFTESLVHGGFLCLGSKESLQLTAVSDRYRPAESAAKIYRKEGM